MSKKPNDDSKPSPTVSIAIKASPQSQGVLSPLIADTSVSKKQSRKQQKKGTGRALKACNSCRKQKTRCLPWYNSIACLRCVSVGMICSFEEEAILQNGALAASLVSPANDTPPPHLDGKSPEMMRQQLATGGGSGNGLVDARLKMLQNDVSEILGYLKRNVDGDKLIEDQASGARVSLSDMSNPDTVIPLTDVSRVKLFQYSNSVVDLNSLPSFGVPSSSFKTSPFKTFDDMCASVNNKSIVARFLKDTSTSLPQSDIVTLRLITLEDATNLLQYFRDRYGRWVSFPDDITTEDLLVNLRRRGSLLLTTCCCLSLKYGNIALKNSIYFQLFERLKSELKESLVHTPQTVEFLQSLVVLSLYGITLSNAEMNIDSWYTSGIGLQQFITKDISGQLMNPENIPPYYDREFYELTVHRIWNHLSLCHIVYCLYTGRMCIIDELRLNFSRKILDISNSTNFDGRIVAEVSLQLLVYNFIQFSNSQRSLQLVKDELKGWFDQWSYLFDQPANQFVELGYHYGYLLILYNWNYMKHMTRDDCEEILLNADSISIRSMIFHCQKILDAMLDTPNDSYFAFLSDQIHFTANFGILMLMRILHVINLKNYNNDNDNLNKVEMSKNELQKNLNKCLSLSERYKKISTGGSDVFMKYHMTINDTLTQLFHDFIQK